MKITKAYIDMVKVIRENGNIYIDVYWENDENEWGHIDLRTSINNETTINSEHMGKEFVKQVFEKIVDGATLEE